MVSFTALLGKLNVLLGTLSQFTLHSNKVFILISMLLCTLHYRVTTRLLHGSIVELALLKTSLLKLLPYQTAQFSAVQVVNSIAFIQHNDICLTLFLVLMQNGIQGVMYRPDFANAIMGQIVDKCPDVSCITLLYFLCIFHLVILYFKCISCILRFYQS